MRIPHRILTYHKDNNLFDVYNKIMAILFRNGDFCRCEAGLQCVNTEEETLYEEIIF